MDSLEVYWQVFPKARSFLFESADRPGYAQLRPALNEVKRGILEHSEFSAFRQKVEKVFADWHNANTPFLMGFGKDSHPKELIETIAETLLTAFRRAPLLDAYDVYQCLMDYWAESMQNDAYLIAADGWVKGAQPREVVRENGKNSKQTRPEPHDYLKGKRRMKSDLVPAPILVDRYFVAERSTLEAFDEHLAVLMQQLDEMREENGGEDGLLAEVIQGESHKKKITAKAVKARLREIGSDPLYADECAALERYADLLQQQLNVRAKRKAAQEELDKKIDAKYPTLTEPEIKTLVVDDKWSKRLSTSIQREIDRVSWELADRIDQLAERYAAPLPIFIEKVQSLSDHVQTHLETTHQLLTGRTRLPGYEREWEVKRLGDLLTYERPDRYIVKSTAYSNRGDVPVLTANKSFILGYTTETFGVCADLPAIVFDDFTTDSKFATVPFKVKSSAIKLLRPRHDRTSLRYIFERMQLIRFPIGEHKRYYISDYQNIEFSMPEYDEQLAITTVLSDIDAEIAALEALCDKTRNLKQAMMQELLTGKTRLVQQDTAHV